MTRRVHRRSKNEEEYRYPLRKIVEEFSQPSEHAPGLLVSMGSVVILNAESLISSARRTLTGVDVDNVMRKETNERPDTAKKTRT